MKLVKTDYRPIILKRNNDARLAVKEFLNAHIRCVEVTEYSYRSARGCAHRLHMEIKELGVTHIKPALRGEKVYLVNTLIKED